MRRLLFSALCAMAAACGGGQYRFADAPVAWKVADDQSIPEPEEIEYRAIPYMMDVLALRQLTRALEVRTETPAQNVNALDEVPDSSWFQNRIGVRSISPTEIASGGAERGPPVPPLTVDKGKTLGNNIGLWVKDSRGRKYLLKLDFPGHPELHTGAEVLVTRIMWAAGYNVPNNTVFEFGEDELRLEPGAKKTNALGEKVPMTRADLRIFVDTATRTRTGKLRAMASELLEGVPKGGFMPEGTRPDDPNDRIPHEHRRELRGMRVLSAWVNNTDVKQDQSLDMYVTEGGRRFLRHFILDFSESLGGHQAQWGLPMHGHEHLWDWEEQTKALLSFGAYVRPWEGQKETRWPSVGMFDAEHFDPPRWRETYPFWPFAEMTAADAYWGAKLVMRFDRPLLEAIVSQAQYSDPTAAAYIVDTLIARQRKIAQAWLVDAVTPLDHFRVGEDSLCAVDLAVLYGLSPPRVVERLDDEGEVSSSHAEGRRGRVCFGVGSTGEYQRERLRIRFGSTTTPPMQVHFRAGERARLFGVVRTDGEP